MTARVAARVPPAGPPAGSEPLLEVQGLRVEFATAEGTLRVVDGVGFDLRRGEILGLVGESGSGKSVTSLSIMGLVGSRTGRVRADRLRLDGRDLLRASPDELRRLRGEAMAMIFQEPMTSLNPAYTVGDQIAEVVRTHRRASRRDAWSRAVEMLDRVGIPDAARRARDYPHELSGGMRQRVMIAMALACDPALLIADEPTTALDVTIQAQILELLRELQRERAMAVIFVTHDLGVVAELCDRVVVMYAGQVVEERAVADLLRAPRHPYTEGLLASMPQVAVRGRPLTVIGGQVPSPAALPSGCRFHPRCPYAVERCRTAEPALEAVGAAGAVGSVRCWRQAELRLAGTRWGRAEPGAADAPGVPTGPVPTGGRPGPQPSTDGGAVLDVRGLRKEFPVRTAVLRRRAGAVRAVDGIDFALARNETLGLVGESGSGKSTTARLALALVEPTAGTVALDGVELSALEGRQLRAARRGAQIVFQDPYSSLDPRQTIAEAVGEPLELHLGLHRRARDERVAELLESVGLDRSMLRRYPHEFSGGQRQRIALARALALEPRLLVLDEPVSALDVSTQSQVINLLTELRERLSVALLFIAHDLSVVHYISDRIAVMYLGRLVEVGSAVEVYERPAHPYTEALLSAIPVPDPDASGRRRIVLEGDVPSPLDPPPGCRFHTRCPYVMDVCRSVDPEPFTTPAATTVACHLHTSGPTLAGAPVTVLGGRGEP